MDDCFTIVRQTTRMTRAYNQLELSGEYFLGIEAVESLPPPTNHWRPDYPIGSIFSLTPLPHHVWCKYEQGRCKFPVTFPIQCFYLTDLL